jgi:class 3 adenylate cyclase
MIKNIMNNRLINAVNSDFVKLIERATKLVDILRLETITRLETIGIFDLSESTSLKLEIGHHNALKKVFVHNHICHQITLKFKGKIVKDLGDGVLVRFSNPLKACLAAINIKYLCSIGQIKSKGILVLGLVEEAKLDKVIDIYGSTIDRCARIEKYAFPGQLLIDRALYDSTRSFLKSYDDLVISEPLIANLKGYGEQEVYEISTKEFGIKGMLKIDS